MLTPLFLDLSYNISPSPLSQTLPSTYEDLQKYTKILLSEPIYYLLIYPPLNQDSRAGLTPISPIKLNIPKEPNYKNKIRLELFPSIGYGINSCYRVEYWQYQKPLVPETLKTKSNTDLIKKYITHEYWHVPLLDVIYPDALFYSWMVPIKQLDYPTFHSYEQDYIRWQIFPRTYQELEAYLEYRRINPLKYNKTLTSIYTVEDATVIPPLVTTFIDLIDNPEIIKIDSITYTDSQGVLQYIQNFTIIDNSLYINSAPRLEKINAEVPEEIEELKIGIDLTNAINLPTETTELKINYFESVKRVVFESQYIDRVNNI